MPVISRIHAVENHFRDRGLADTSLAARLIIQGLGQAAMLGGQIGKRRVLIALGCRHDQLCRRSGGMGHGSAQGRADCGQDNRQGGNHHAI